MIVTPERCKYFIAKNFKTDINRTCELKGKCQLIHDKASCSKYIDKGE